MSCPYCFPCICTCSPEAVSSTLYDPYPDAPYDEDPDDPDDEPYRTDDDFDPDACDDPEAREHIAHLMGIPR